MTLLQVKEGDGKDDLLGLPVEPTGLEGAAFQSRVPYDKMTQVEIESQDYLMIIFFSRSRQLAFLTW